MSSQAESQLHFEVPSQIQKKNPTNNQSKTTKSSLYTIIDDLPQWFIPLKENGLPSSLLHHFR